MIRLFICLGLCLSLSAAMPLQASQGAQSINAVLGDVSFVEAFGRLPGPEASPDLRIKLHLAYVERKLKLRDVSHLPVMLVSRRRHMLTLLHQYRLAGRFPKNRHFPHQTRPTFIDQDGSICAVGFLIEQTAGRGLAETINARYRNAYLAEMHLPALERWIASSGLTHEELASIQPGYPAPLPLPPDNPVEAPRLFTSLALDTLNLGLLGSQLITIEDPFWYQGLQYTGIAVGAGSVAWGLLNFSEDNGRLTFRSYLSLIDISLGLAGILISTHQLLHPPSHRAEAAPLQLGNIRAYQNQQALGLAYTHRF